MSGGGLGLLHTSAVHVAAFDALAQQEAPGRTLRHLVRTDLLEQAREHGPESVADELGEALVELGAEVVLCTCSTIGGVAERVGGGSVLRVDRPMAAAAVAAAVSAGGPVVVLAALESTLPPTLDLLAEEAARTHRSPELQVRLVPDAWARFEAGDLAGYHAAVAHAVEAVARELGPAVVVLAQASMAPAAGLARVGVPVLSSPRLGLRAALRRADRRSQPSQSPSAAPTPVAAHRPRCR